MALSLAGLSVFPASTAHAQTLTDPTGTAADAADAPEAGTIDIASLTDQSDRATEAGLRQIYSKIDGLAGVEVAVQSGVVRLSGTVINQADREQALAIAQRIAGVVTVENGIERSLEVDSNLSPALSSLNDDFRGLIRGLPLFGVAVLAALLIAAAGYVLAAQRRLWVWVTPNAFLAELVMGAIKVVAIIAGLIIALQILDATALLGLVLGSAGIIGIALGFAVRDTVDNYVSSLMLSLRQPFRANDHVIIDTLEGHVIRLTSRATVLMTLDGNHLRIPNATVFKANILNFTRNPQRRFEFDLGVDSADDPLAAMRVGLDAMRALPFVLDEPRSHAIIQAVGDSSIVLRFFAWVDQQETDYMKGRSLAIQAAKSALEEAGYELPEPIYRIRVEDFAKLPKAGNAKRVRPEKPTPAAPPIDDEHAARDRTIEQLVSEERGAGEKDLLDTRRPIE
ncbi:MAG: mechanosensitive ion channel [Sphingomonadales bacterium]|nr:mechanosensitive ion channel [Sphingomonadales bacterium]NCQ22597.1 mechanosensitive ion channel [Sphingomonadales bacterium]NCT04047.1 mechanosensitive ion channel [Sphingomonadales bacterium]